MSKRFNPIVYYGAVSYSHTWDENLSVDNEEFRVQPGDQYGLNMGASLAVTPSIYVDAGLSLIYVDGTEYELDNGPTATGSSFTVGYFNLGTGVLLARNS